MVLLGTVQVCLINSEGNKGTLLHAIARNWPGCWLFILTLQEQDPVSIASVCVFVILCESVRARERINNSVRVCAHAHDCVRSIRAAQTRTRMHTHTHTNTLAYCIWPPVSMNVVHEGHQNYSTHCGGKNESDLGPDA